MSTAVAQDSPKFKAKIKVSVTAEDTISGIVISYINRELRSLTDVELVDIDPKWEIKILAIESFTSGGYESGIIISAVILYCNENYVLKYTAPNSCKDHLNEFLKPHYAFESNLVIVGPPEDLKKLCSKIVAEFDINYLEKARKIHQTNVELLNKNNNFQ